MRRREALAGDFRASHCRIGSHDVILAAACHSPAQRGEFIRTGVVIPATASWMIVHFMLLTSSERSAPAV